jgi:L-glyceraldehyde reductase
MLDTGVSLKSVWKQMETLVAKGLVRSIGVSNFTRTNLESLLADETLVKPAILQIESHPYLQQESLVKYCSQNGITVVAYSPLGASRLDVMENPVINQVAIEETKRQGIPIGPAQVLLLWNLSRGHATIPKSSNPERMRANLDVTLKMQPLSKESIEKIRALDKEQRAINPSASFGVDCFKE